MNKGGIYSLCGWRVRSEVRLPELPAWRGDDRGDGIEFVIGELPATLGETVLKTDGVEVSVEGARVRMAIRNVGVYLIESGNRIVVEPGFDVDPHSPDVRLFLLGAGLGYLCHQRGLLPLHASAVEIDGRAVLFTGVSGAGKSTLASAFLQRGYRLLSDDVVPVEMTAGTAMVLPSIARIRLWPDSAAQAGWRIDEMEPCRRNLLKVARPIDAAAMTGALEPSAIFHLRPPGPLDGSTPRLVPISGARAVTALGTRVYRERGLMAIAGRRGGMERIAAVAARIPRHFRLERRIDYASLPATVEAVLDGLRSMR